MKEKSIETDVLVVGCGGAGLRAAIEASEHDAKVILVSKGPFARSGATLLAGADLTLDGKSLHALGFQGEPKDTKQKFFGDIVTQGFYLSNQKLVQTYVQDAPERVKELLDWGLKVGFSEERAIFASSTSILNALSRKAKENNILIMEDIMLVNLLTKGAKIAGAIGIEINTGEFITFKSKSVILATGGWHKAFSPNAGTRELTGDGVAMTYRVGAELANMEFVTFCPNVLLWPPIWRGNIFLYVIHLLIGGQLVNAKGENFLDKYDPKIVKVGTSTEWNKCFLSIATVREVLEGKGTPHGGVYYKAGMPWDVFESRLTEKYPNWKYKGIDFSELRKMLKEEGSVEVGPAAEYFEGGIVVNERCETNISGLYAAGECTASLFGANRVAAATTEMLVEGAIAGRFAADYAKKSGIPDIDKKQVDKLQEKAILPLKLKEGIKPAELLRNVQKAAYEKLGLIRDNNGLSEFVKYIEMVKKDQLPKLCTVSKSMNYNKEWFEALELENIVQLLELSAKSAVMRTESRGVHYRSDYAWTDNDNWLKEIVLREDAGDLHVTKRPVIITSLMPPSGVTPYLEMVKKLMEAHSEIGGHH
jgi:succinate dehydrogenase/fumarate reductase flavoprotein subunit